MRSGTPITCRECGRENAARASFCGGCGARLDGVCGHCGRGNEPGAHFCNGCGRSLAGGAGAERGGGPPGPARVCPRCHRGNEPLSQFCYHCGLPFEGLSGDVRTVPLPPAFASGRPAGFCARFVAFIIDSVVLVTALGVILPLFGSSIQDYYGGEEFSGADLISIALGAVYATLLVGTFSTTVGKRALNLYVLRPDGSRVGYGRALARHFATALSVLLLGVGLLMIAFRSDKRGLHDLLADTVVVMR